MGAMKYLFMNFVPYHNGLISSHGYFEVYERLESDEDGSVAELIYAGCTCELKLFYKLEFDDIFFHASSKKPVDEQTDYHNRMQIKLIQWWNHGKFKKDNCKCEG